MARHLLMLLLAACISLLNAHIVPATEEPVVDENNVQGTIDEIIAKASNSSPQYETFYNEEGNDMVKVEYDMVFTSDEYAEMQRLDKEAESTSGRSKRTNGIINGRDGGWRWTSNIVPYQMAPNTFTKSENDLLLAAMKDWGTYTCLTFKHQYTGNRIYFQNGAGCNSRVGMVGRGLQALVLAKSCRIKGIMIHEIGHALGLHHEQGRPDRDSYVRIIYKNLPQKNRYIFNKNQWQSVLKLNIPYDYSSIMHYGKTAFSSNGGITIQTIDPKYQDVIGNIKGLSFRDIKTVNLMYNCNRHKAGCTKKDTDCPGEGFVGKDCRCWCPGGSISNPVKYCDGGTGILPTAQVTTVDKETDTKTDCDDRNTRCSYWARIGECNTNPAYMLVFCKKSCGKCMKGTVVEESSCINSNDTKCEFWAKNGECTRNPEYMLKGCRLACGKCSVDVTAEATTTTQEPTTTTTKKPANCFDKSTNCSYWAKTGYCRSNHGYMSINCKSSCNLC